MGPRQAGKTTLAQHLINSDLDIQYYNLKDPDTRRALTANARKEFEYFREHLIVLDEVRQMPDLVELIQLQVDIQFKSPAAQPANQRITGRKGFYLHPFSIVIQRTCQTLRSVIVEKSVTCAIGKERRNSLVGILSSGKTIKHAVGKISRIYLVRWLS